MSALSSEAPLASSTYHSHSLTYLWNQIQTPSPGHDRGRGDVDGARCVRYARSRRCIRVCDVHGALSGLGGRSCASIISLFARATEFVSI
jgi:hypothetical protein